MRRLLHVIDSLGAGGAEQSFAAMVPGFVAAGIDVHVAYLIERPGLHERYRDAGAALHHLAGPGRLAWTAQTRSLARSLRPDLVHTTLFEADIAGRVGARLARVPCVTSLVNETYGPEHRSDPTLSVLELPAAQAVDVATARLARRFHAVSEHVADTMARHLLLDRERIDVIPRGRDPRVLGTRTEERRRRARQALGVVDEPLVVTLARHEYQKGIDVLFDAMPAVLARRPDARLVVAGREGGETDALARQATQLGIESSVSMLGMRDDVPELLCAADVFVLASRREGMPGSVIEAMALEAPVVASDIPQVREVISGSVASLVLPDSAPALANTILGVLAHPDLTAAHVRLAYERFVDRFTIGRVVEQMIAFYTRSLQDG